VIDGDEVVVIDDVDVGVKDGEGDFVIEVEGVEEIVAEIDADGVMVWDTDGVIV
jgi:hypothetical protein